MMPSPNQEPSLASRESGRLHALWIAGLVFAAILRLVFIEAHGLWNNEFITLRVIKQDYWDLIQERLSVNHMPFYFIMEKAWTDVFGTSEASLRAISAIFGWLAVWAVGRLARRIAGLRFAVPVVFGAAIHQLWLNTSLDARMYSMLVWAAAEATDAWFAWTRAESEGDRAGARRSLARWTLVSVFSIHVHMLFAAVFVFHLFDALLRRWKDKLSLRGPAIAMGLGVLLCVPISVAWVLNQNKFGDTTEPNFKTLGVLHRQTIRFFAGDFDSLESYIDKGPLYTAVKAVAYLLFVISLVGLVRLFRRTPLGAPDAFFPSPAARRDLLGLAWSYPLFLIGLYVAQTQSDSQILGSERYYAVFFPAVLVFSFAGLMYWMLQNRNRGLMFAGATFLLQGVFTTAYYLGPGAGFRDGIEMIESDLPEHRGVVAVMSGGGQTGLNSYYGKGLTRKILYIDRYEERRAPVREQLEVYTDAFSEFWVIVYREKEETIWKVLESPGRGYVPLTERHEMGRTIVQLFRAPNRSADQKEAPDPENADERSD